MIHIALHFLVPLLAALAFYRDRWRSVTLILVGTMLVDLDHLLATPVYDPERCSIGFHPLHTTPAIAMYVALFLLPAACGSLKVSQRVRSVARVLHLVGLGLLIHMALDGLDCRVQWP